MTTAVDAMLRALLEALDNVWRKTQLLSIGVLHLLFSSDSRRPRIAAGAAVRAATSTSASTVQRTYGTARLRSGTQGTELKAKKKQIIFVRHAESEWNVVFNRGVWWMAIVRFFRAVVREALLLPTSDSIFIDSPLSRLGIRQVKALYLHVSEALTPPEDPATAPSNLLRYLGSPVPKSIVVASNLRRAIDTARIASATRLDAPGEKIHVVSYLQEIGRNIDTLALTNAYALPSQTLSTTLQGEKEVDDLFNVSESHGNKAVLGSGRQRLYSFAQWSFCQSAEVLVVYGHSHWFRAFCQEFFPGHVFHTAKTEKLPNCGVVSLELEEQVIDGKQSYAIVPESFQFVR
ncbi:hypothetical protein Poli38472_006418 [Pythium oligandrum]|uniref:Uncharacterized protein n=1 Tax=Pythium oligandrum TaxID=41045 RepID=A0A8K1C4Z9_PYTOL|nr:hypothetical protein Poli38472_006418 [Pythium oligandrum]|eukprot:TMW56408.1 hypothetical protein Poli38472_006418 [Pythium oligandrum]